MRLFVRVFSLRKSQPSHLQMFTMTMAFASHHVWFRSLLALSALQILICTTSASAETVQHEVKINVDASAEANDELTCALDKLALDNKEVLDKVYFSVHHNGNPESCGSTPSSLKAIQKSLQKFDCNTKVNKYEMESLLTDLFTESIGSDECSITDNVTAPEGLYHFCDMGPQRTVIQLDHDSLVRTAADTLPCRFFTREGVRIASFDQLTELASQAREGGCTDDATDKTCAAGPMLDLYAVPAGRVFMFAPTFVGETFDISHVRDSTGQPITVEVLSTDPRVFDLHNFFSDDEARALVDKALNEKSPTYALHRSTTGTTSKSVFNKRTSENAWDTHGKIALQIKGRCMSVLGFDEYIESHTDGLQILRYNLTTAYTPHMDYLEDKAYTQPYDYESDGKGGNRFATILLYFSDIEANAGGETVFPRAWPAGATEVSKTEAIQMLRDSGDATMLSKGSWEEEMSSQCRTRLSVRPKISRAVLFYSQHPNGTLDQKSFHGGCPVLDGTKWAANLWAWNAPRPEYPGGPVRDGAQPKEASVDPDKLSATFTNTGKNKLLDKAQLYFDESGFFGELGPGKTVKVNTFETHKWNIMVDGKALHTFYITGEADQHYEV